MSGEVRPRLHQRQICFIPFGLVPGPIVTPLEIGPTSAVEKGPKRDRSAAFTPLHLRHGPRLSNPKRLSTAMRHECRAPTSRRVHPYSSPHGQLHGLGSSRSGAPPPKGGTTNDGRWLQHTLLLALRLYRLAISPVLTAALGPMGLGCRFTPTCSQYAMEAIREHGAVSGTRLAARRLCRCHPWGGWGHDPVPPVSLEFQPAKAKSMGHGS
jgi:uncharacterized protein